MRYFDTFTGYGGFTLGINNAYGTHNNRQINDRVRGETENIPEDLSDNNSKNIQGAIPTCVGFSEIDKYAIQVYQKHFPNHKNYGDITKLDPGTIPDFDLLTGGFPCQAFSIAGKRMGFSDTRGTLFYDLARIIKHKKPKLLLLENVKGLLSHDNQRTFETILCTLSELGYGVEWQVLNSKNFGVPQNRERVFIVGHLGGFSGGKVFPVGEADGTIDERYGKTSPQVEVASTIRSRYGNGTGSHIQQLNQPTHSNDRVYSDEELSPTLNTMGGGNRQPFISNDTRIRRLTPTECERLQGLPDGWTKEGTEGAISDTQRYKLCGNGVTTNVVQAIMEKILALY